MNRKDYEKEWNNVWIALQDFEYRMQELKANFPTDTSIIQQDYDYLGEKIREMMVLLWELGYEDPPFPIDVNEWWTAYDD